MSAVSRTGNIFEDVAIKAAVRLASIAGNLTLSGLQTIDGTAGADGDRILVTAQTDPTENGIWQVTTGNWQRTADARQNTDLIDGTLVLVARGSVCAGKLFMLQVATSPAVIGTTALVFTAQSDVITAQQTATSATSNTIGTGAKTFAVQTGKDFTASRYVLIYKTSGDSNAMLASITSYTGGSLVVSVVATSGSGTHTDWTIVLANSPASAGRVPPIGTGNVTGPGSSVAGRLPTFTDTTGKVLQDSGITPGTLAGRNALLYGDGGTAAIPEGALVPGAAPLVRTGAQPADNLRLVNDGSNATRDINVTAGRCRDDSDVTNLFLAATMVKRLDTAWAAGGASGSPVGGCDTGTKGASQTWHAFLIAKRNLVITAFSRTSNVATITVAAHGGGVGGTVRAFGMGSGMDAIAAISAVGANTISYANAGVDIALTAVAGVADLYDVLGSQSYASPTKPGGWTVKQCLGSFLTDGSGNIRAMTHIGDEFFLTTQVDDSITASATRQNMTLTVPLGVSVMAMARAYSQGGTATAFVFTALSEADLNPSTVPDLAQPGNSLPTVANIARLTDTSARIGVRASQTVGFLFSTYGWRDPRRRLF